MYFLKPCASAVAAHNEVSRARAYVCYAGTCVCMCDYNMSSLLGLLVEQYRQEYSYLLLVNKPIILAIIKDFKISLYYLIHCQKWELYVLSSLGWDLSFVTPLDFLELFIIQLSVRCKVFSGLNINTVRNNAQTFIYLAAKGKYNNLTNTIL